jgi:hypothetical protein
LCHLTFATQSCEPSGKGQTASQSTARGDAATCRAKQICRPTRRTAAPQWVLRPETRKSSSHIPSRAPCHSPLLAPPGSHPRLLRTHHSRPCHITASEPLRLPDRYQETARFAAHRSSTRHLNNSILCFPFCFSADCSPANKRGHHQTARPVPPREMRPCLIREDKVAARRSG